MSNFSGAYLSPSEMVTHADAKESLNCTGKCWERLVNSLRLNALTCVQVPALQTVLFKQVDWITLGGAAKIFIYC